MTDASGDYSFPNLLAGDYIVVEVQPTGYFDVTEGGSNESWSYRIRE